MCIAYKALAWKKWPTIWHADVSRWLTLSIHGCLWISLLVCLSVHLSVWSFTAFSGGCAFADKSLFIIGRWLLPSLVDTGDICCHYWQHILVFQGHGFEMMHKAWCGIDEVPYCFPRSSIKFQGHMGQKQTIFTGIERLWTVTPVWIHWWLSNDDQSLT